jgi:hypothetical protein
MGIERILPDRLIAMRSVGLSLDMEALASLVSISSAVPSTPGGPDLAPPSADGSTSSMRSLSKAESVRLAAAMAAMAHADLHPPHAPFMGTGVGSRPTPQPLETEQLTPSTPSQVKPLDWDVTMWTRANVDGSL